MNNLKTEKYKEIKKGWYNFVLDKPLKGGEGKLIQYIIEVKRKLWSGKYKTTNSERHWQY